jgi:hypothetical protein
MTYRLSPEDRDAAVKRIRDEENDIPRIYLDSHNPPIPTLASGLALTKPDGTPFDRDTLISILNSVGQKPHKVVTTGQDRGDQLVDNLTKSLNRFKTKDNSDGYEEWYPGIRYKNPPPLGINITPEQSTAATQARVYDAADAIRNRIGQDPSGAYHFDRLTGDEKGALIDAYHNSPTFIGPGLVAALQHQDDPDWRDKVRYELDVNVKEPNNRRRHEADAFAIIDPPQNLFNSDSFLQSPVGNLLNAPGDGDNLLNSIERKLGDGMALQWARPSSG